MPSKNPIYLVLNPSKRTYEIVTGPPDIDAVLNNYGCQRDDFRSPEVQVIDATNLRAVNGARSR